MRDAYSEACPCRDSCLPDTRQNASTPSPPRARCLWWGTRQSPDTSDDFSHGTRITEIAYRRTPTAHTNHHRSTCASFIEPTIVTPNQSAAHLLCIAVRYKMRESR